MMHDEHDKIILKWRWKKKMKKEKKNVEDKLFGFRKSNGSFDFPQHLKHMDITK